MENEITHIDLLISKNLSGEATSAEKEELKRWIGESPCNRKVFGEQKRVWEKANTYLAPENLTSDREKIKDKIIAQLSKTSTRKISLSGWIVRAAAILALPVMLAIGYSLGTRSDQAETQLCEVTAPKGQISKCVLADGTQVWLNAGSTITYDPMLKGDVRRIRLDGEAYFKVTKNKHKPFIVTTRFAQVKVLGTVFDLKAYSGDERVETTLEEGHVEFSLPGTAIKPVELKSGEQVVYNIAAKKITVGNVDTYLHTGWKDGKYVFKDADLQTIINELDRLYDVRIHVEDDSLLHLHLRGMFEYDQNIFSALEKIEQTTNIKYRIDGRDIWLK